MSFPNYAGTHAGHTSDGPAGWATYKCHHDGAAFTGYSPPAMCGCGAHIDSVWMVSVCGDCRRALYYPRGTHLSKRCGGDGQQHKPTPDSVDEPPTR